MRKATRNLIEIAVKEIGMEEYGYKVVTTNNLVIKIDMDADYIYQYTPLQFFEYILKDWLNRESIDDLVENKDYLGNNFYKFLKERFDVMFQVEQEIEILKREGEVR